ncbi:DNA mismatch repair endonuclease MutL [Flavobacteriaceae bacterium]|jgi:DNA mismatch repair protein MutL|nr:DNA mismatch repair endonuclease MutL [Flavobacteriaceae bacterium]
MDNLIKLLPDHVANQIAAGEVVQRPSSVVKELLENSIDSGAKKISLLIKESGRTLIQVVDNGCGMSKKDALICFQRHSTSKITSAADLFNLSTKGFRGEALASIAAISHSELITKTKSCDIGTFIRVEGNKIIQNKSIVSNEGSSISVKNLFYNVPARRNFLKSDNVEVRHIINEFHRVALAHPEIHFEFDNNDNQLFSLPISNIRQRIVNIFGSKSNEKLVPVNETTEVLKLSGFIFKPEFSKKSRGEQFFFVNNRFIKSPYLNHAVNSAFEGLINSGYNASYFLFLDVDPKRIDINIHPTKTEIKFDDDHTIYAILRSAIKHSLGQFNISPILDFDRDKNLDIPYKYASMSTTNNIEVEVNHNFNPFDKNQNELNFKDSNQSKEYQQLEYSSFQGNINLQLDLEGDLNHESTSNVFQLKNKYLVNKIKSGLVIINQNRAHQRILYENFLKYITVQGNDSQKLMYPVEIQLSIKEIAIIENFKTQLNNSGFLFDTVNNDTLSFSSLPSSIEKNDLESIVRSLLDNITNEIPDNNFSQTDMISKSLAKSMAIKNGQNLNANEMDFIVNGLFACKEPNISPFNKRTYITLTKEDLDNKFN